MKNQSIILFVLLVLSLPLAAQYKLNIAGGYFGQNLTSPGVVLEFEYEKFYKEDFSAPLRGNITFFSDPDYNAIVIDIHKGFRKYFSNGLFVEQSVGIGVINTSYKLESIWYYDNYTNNILYSDGLNLGVIPSVTAGLGYNIAPKSTKQNLIWIRPKLYWNLGFRGLNMPYGAIQVGYTYTIKTN